MAVYWYSSYSTHDHVFFGAGPNLWCVVVLQPNGELVLPDRAKYFCCIKANHSLRSTWYHAGKRLAVRRFYCVFQDLSPRRYRVPSQEHLCIVVLSLAMFFEKIPPPIPSPS